MKIEEISKTKAEVEIINSIKNSHKDLRQRSKGCTFALTYAGTWMTLVKNFGFTEEEAKHIEKQYHDLYKVSDHVIAQRLEEASRKGYVEVAFGLKVRCPKMYQSVMGDRATPKEAEAEKRTAGNAIGQSFGLLTNRAGIEFNSLVRNSKYRLMIKPMIMIHDALYYLIRDNTELVLWVNKNLSDAVKWQDEPQIRHDKVHLSGELSIFYPDWAHELSLDNETTKEELISKVKSFKENL